MADTKISAELSASTLTGAEIIPVVQGGANRKATLSQVVADLGLSGGGGGAGGAPTDAEYIVNAASSGLSAERVVTDNSVIAKDVSVAGQISYTLVDNGVTTSKIAANAVGNARLAKMPANTIKVNNTASTADPTDLAIPVSSLIGRGATGDLAALTIGTGLTVTSGVISASGGGGGGGNVTWDGTNFKDGSGNIILFNNGSYTWAAKPSAATAGINTHIKIDPSSFGGTHKRTVGPTAESDGTKWMPAGGAQLLCRGSGSIAAPLATASGVTDTPFNIAAPFSFPAGFFEYTGGGLRVRAKFRKTGADATASVFSIKIGKFTTAANDSIASLTTTAAAGRDVIIDETMQVTATGVGNTASYVSGTIKNNDGSQPAILTDKASTGFDTTQIMYIVITAKCVANAAATHELINYEVWWIA